MTSSIKNILETGPVIPVLALKNPDDAVPLARALVDGGVHVLEITLRTPIALDAIRLISKEVENAIVGVGTVLTVDDFNRAAVAGAKFAVSPRLTDALATAANLTNAPLPLLPGVATASELMRAQDAGFEYFKLFPAEASGGQDLLKSLSGPFPNCKFCPTGGITPQSAPDYLALSNVVCVGGSWLAPTKVIDDKDWSQITRLAQAVAR